MIGPLYADSAEIAHTLLNRSSQDIPGDHFTINIWYVRYIRGEAICSMKLELIRILPGLQRVNEVFAVHCMLT